VYGVCNSAAAALCQAAEAATQMVDRRLSLSPVLLDACTRGAASATALGTAEVSDFRLPACGHRTALLFVGVRLLPASPVHQRITIGVFPAKAGRHGFGFIVMTRQELHSTRAALKDHLTLLQAEQQLALPATALVGGKAWREDCPRHLATLLRAMSPAAGNGQLATTADSAAAPAPASSTAGSTAASGWRAGPAAGGAGSGAYVNSFCELSWEAAAALVARLAAFAAGLNRGDAPGRGQTGAAKQLVTDIASLAAQNPAFAAALAPGGDAEWAPVAAAAEQGLPQSAVRLLRPALAAVAAALAGPDSDGAAGGRASGGGGGGGCEAEATARRAAEIADAAMRSLLKVP